ncbi:ATP-dependent DNA helicase [Zhongshania aquimaris]|uniref:ATP-dependent DNA helicase n=1 Tax=Zhongshania aquimaris TaxID=2857107 RepID=A0ABS6VN84_9GAMM|nr:ATP-dependent DNA helicase [Zhongshania aquimaris]MBW2939741.1 ATP-dependent DNA helicase [Zhongshania aquimaris]
MMRVSVRSLCEFAARTGSLEFRYTPAPTSEEGMMGHVAVQQRRPDPYVAEYALKGQCAGLEVSGRVDGYYANQQECFLEEIKTHRGNVNRIGPGRRDLHWAQLKVYGALLCQRDKRDSIALRLTYFEVRDELETTEDITFEATELEDYLEELCRCYISWAKQETAHREARDNALLALSFPHPEFRAGQHSLAKVVYLSAKNAVPLLLQAPTGIGKTVGVLFPALRAMPEVELDRVFFLTNRNTGRKLGLDGLRIILDSQSLSLPLRVLELSSREAACDNPDKACHGDSCPLAKGFFDRLPAARQQAVEEGFLTQSTLRRIAGEHNVCRYFLAQEMARWCDVVVADVNHYYDQFALLYSLTIANEWRVMPLVDEAHNLIDRARGMYSIALGEAEMLYGIRKVPAPLLKPMSELEIAWASMIRPFLDSDEDIEQRRYYLKSVPEDLNTALYGLISAITDYLTDNPAAAEVQNVLFTALGFLRLADKFDEHSLCTLEFETFAGSVRAKPGSAKLLIDNLIPADHLAQRFIDAVSTILFSATLSPAGYHQDLLGLPQTTNFIDIESPFAKEQIDLRLVTTISTRHHDREDSLVPICARIIAQYKAKPGNYLVYLSSFDYLNTVYKRLGTLAPALRLLRQTPGMPPFEREQFISDISDTAPSVAFAVLGGVFGEGIDLPGDKLIGVFVATLGLAPHDEFHEVLRERLEARYGRGYDYTYIYPGLQKVIQAAGRLIRTPEDRGVIELIDARYAWKKVRSLLPTWWGI